MSKFKIINLIDKIFITTAIFLMIYAWINFFVRDLWITFILSLIFTFASTFLLFYMFNKKQEKQKTTKQQFLDMNEKFLAFKLLNIQDKLNLVKLIIENKNTCTIVDNVLLYKDNEKNVEISIYTEQEKLTQNTIENLISNRHKATEILKIICCDMDANLNTKLLKNLEIEIITKSKLYNDYFLQFSTFPLCENLNTKKEKKKFKEVLKNFFIPSKAKSYFLCGLILIFSSIILPYHTYYLIFGSILLIFSIICKLQPLFKC